MPTYEFRCPEGHEFEKFYRKITDAAELPCPECGKPATRLVSGGAGLLFKGSGFYLTDSRKAAESKSAEAKPADGKPAAAASSDSSSSTTAPTAAAPAASSGDSKPKSSESSAA